jgi:hypothetical protein
MTPVFARYRFHVGVRDLAGLVKREIQAIRAVGRVGREDGVQVVGLRRAEAVRGVGFVCIGCAIVPGGVFHHRPGGERRYGRLVRKW